MDYLLGEIVAKERIEPLEGIGAFLEVEREVDYNVLGCWGFRVYEGSFYMSQWWSVGFGKEGLQKERNRDVF